MRLKCLFSFFRMRQRILTSGIDLLYVHSPETALPFLSNSAGIPVIFHQHGSGNPMERSKFGWGRNRLFKGLFNAFTGMIHRQADWTIAIDRLCVETGPPTRDSPKVITADECGRFAIFSS